MNQRRPTPLKTNPFTTYRDPETGRWQVVPADSSNPGCDRMAEGGAYSTDEGCRIIETATAR
ncbi:MAG: hypothetical protein IGR76_01320 [Synechococcales cyanobacterium T60_A2020_003]|nr:hypothetical protein [Synechococcales cyanobacterium T60_A2020_003]